MGDLDERLLIAHLLSDAGVVLVVLATLLAFGSAVGGAALGFAEVVAAGCLGGSLAFLVGHVPVSRFTWVGSESEYVSILRWWGHLTAGCDDWRSGARGDPGGSARGGCAVFGAEAETADVADPGSLSGADLLKGLHGYSLRHARLRHLRQELFLSVSLGHVVRSLWALAEHVGRGTDKSCAVEFDA